jgi:F0F1-type ATP synthase membrane subunit b/b'
MLILHQLAELFLQAAPTVVILVFFLLFMRWAFFTPITKAMAERTARIDGARAEAAAAQAAAQQELDAYGNAMKKARNEIYAQQSAGRQAALDKRAMVVKDARTRAAQRVEEGKQRIAQEVEAARTQVDHRAPELAAALAENILQKPANTMRGIE